MSEFELKMSITNYVHHTILLKLETEIEKCAKIRGESLSLSFSIFNRIGNPKLNPETLKKYENYIYQIISYIFKILHLTQNWSYFLEHFIGSV